MTSNRTAPGRLPASVYRRRRLMVLLGVVAVIIAIVLIVVRPGASQGDEVAQSVPPTTPASSSASDAPATDAPATDDADEPAESEPPAEPAVDGAACTEGQIIVEAVTDAQVYASGEQPKLSVTVTNTGANTCALNVGTAAQVFTVSSGKETYWSSTDCQVDAVDATVLLAPGTPVSSTEPIVWDRTRSTPETCGGPRTAAPAGGASYHLSVSVSGFEAGATKQFLLY